MSNVLILHKGIAPFEVGTSIDAHIAVLDFEFEAGGETETWDDYLFFDGSIEVYVNRETRIIESVASRERCFYEGENLIGMPFERFLAIFSIESTSLEVDELWMTDDEKQKAYEVPVLSMQVWVDDNGVIATLFVG